MKDTTWQQIQYKAKRRSKKGCRAKKPRRPFFMSSRGKAKRTSGNGVSNAQWNYTLVNLPFFTVKDGIAGDLMRRVVEIDQHAIGLDVLFFFVHVPYAWHLEQFKHKVLQVFNLRNNHPACAAVHFALSFGVWKLCDLDWVGIALVANYFTRWLPWGTGSTERFTIFALPFLVLMSILAWSVQIALIVAAFLLFFWFGEKYF
ncbi:MAG: hypothetical protein ACRCT6_04110 [Notoacmeibacter sp.]